MTKQVDLPEPRGPVQLAPGDTLHDGRFALEAEVGQGSVATVWRAVDAGSGAPVAIKVMHGTDTDLEDVQRLAQEVEILKTLAHPCIVKPFGTGVDPAGNPYVVMEWVEGITLRDKLDEQPRPPADDVADIVGQICAALAEAHEHGVIHRDIKPENVLLCAPEHLAVKVVDFGMAKVLGPGAPSLTMDDKIFGTPQYMAPERARGSSATGAMDVYAVAVMAYEMLAGRRPFDGKSAIQILARQTRDAPPPLTGVAPAVAEVVLAGLAKEPEARPEAREFGRRLAGALSPAAPA